MQVAELMGAVGALLTALGGLIYHARHQGLDRAVNFSVGALALAMWFTGNAMVRSYHADGVTHGTGILAASGMIMGGASIVAACSYVLLRRAGAQEWEIPLKLRVLFVAEPALVVATMAVWPWLYFDGTPAFNPQIGFILHSTYAMGLMLVGVMSLVARFAHSDAVSQRQMSIVVAGVILIFVSEAYQLDLTPFVVLAAWWWIAFESQRKTWFVRSSLMRGESKYFSIDAVTGVPARREVDRALAAALRASGDSRPVSVLMVDVDGFKLINDQRGHLSGDEALAEVAIQLQRLAGKGSTVGRFGGDEFLVVMPGVSGDIAMKRAERMRFAIAEHASATVSIGVASLVGSTAGELIGMADAAMYVAKRRGRNRVVDAADTLASRPDEDDELGLDTLAQ